MKKHILMVLTLVMATTAASAQLTVREKWDKLSGNRFDFLNAAGERVASRYSNYYDTSSVWFQTSFNKPEDGFTVVDGSGNPFTSIEVVPYGVNSYPLELSTEESEISYTYHILPEWTDTNGDGKVDYDDIDFSKFQIPAPDKATARAGENADVKCGELILFTFDIPDGTYPMVSYNLCYTEVFAGEPRFFETTVPVISLLYNHYDSFNRSWLYSAEYRRQVLEYYGSNGSLYPDPVVKNRWHYISYMPNEPMNVKFSAIRLDRDLINRVVYNASEKVYCGLSSINEYCNPFVNGEPWIMMQCGEAISQDDISNLAYNRSSSIISPKIFSKAKNWQVDVPWTYYMGMIDMANFYLQKIDMFKSESVEMRDNAKAVMRILRANSYLRLMQLFGPRWEDSNNGATPVAPLLTEWGNLDLPASSMADLRDFCKEDLEFAIAKLDGICRPGPIPTADVARGLLVRLSLLCHDWQTAATQSKILLDKYPLTSNDELKAGFFKPTESWIWTAPETSSYGIEQLGYYSFQSVAAVNGAYPLHWNIGCQIGSIDRDLFLAIPENDVRRSMFVMPENIVGYRPSSFFNPNGVDANDMKLLNMSRIALAVVNKNKPEGVDMKIENLPNGSTPNFFFGSQFKFWGSSTGSYSSDDNVCLMRADEFLLARAEALYELGDEAGALDCLNRLNSMRNPGYAFQGTGTALRDEIRLSRRIELWGEGHSFFDFKRWNLPIVRRAWVADDTESGNWPEAAAGTFPASGYNGWRYLVPKQAVKANPNLDLSAYGYTDPAGYEDDPAPAALPAKALKTAKNQPAQPHQLKAQPDKELSPLLPLR